jgi:3-hydroxyacyl-[acyl-carrier-protein] dehydratase
MDSEAIEPKAGAASKAVPMIDIGRIMQLIPHRYPFLLIDRLIDVVPFASATGVKNVSINEPHFQGHFPQRAVMPGVLIIEAMAQTAGALVVHSLGPEAEGKLVYFMTIENARFRRPVVPGDQLMIHVVKERSRGNVWKFNGEAKVNGTLVAEATYSAMIMDE